MSNTTYNKFLIFFALLFIIVIYLLINTSVSLKYETDAEDCISKINGSDLCFQIGLFKIIAIVCGIAFVVLIWSGKKILRKN